MPFKHLLAAAAFIASGLTNAAPTYDWRMTSGTAQLTLTDDTASALSATYVKVITQVPIPNIPGMDNTQAGNTNAASYTPGTRTLTLALDDGGVSQGDALPSIRSTNAFVNFRRSLFDDDGNVTYHSALMRNWSIDLDTSTVYADIYTRDNLDAAQSLGRQAVFTASWPGVITLGTEGKIVVDDIDPQGHAIAHASGQLNGLNLTPEAANLLFAAWHLSPEAVDTMGRIFRTQQWGQVQFLVQLSGTPAVPEPSSYALIGAGLAALCFVKRKRT
jgi:hypothetical protein